MAEEDRLRVNDYNIPENLYYTEEHEWALIESSGRVRMGITDYAQKSLHEAVFVEVPKKGTHVKRMDIAGTVESVKAVSEVYSPISGRIIDVNEELEQSPELINQDPYGRGWIAIIEPTNLKEELGMLLRPAQYAEHIKKLL